MKSCNKIAFVIVAHDGLVSLCTGVGVVAHSFIEAFEDISRESKFLRENKVDLFCLAPFLQENSPDFRKEIKNITRNMCFAYGGMLINIPTFSNGESQSSIWGGPTQWLGASLSASRFLCMLANKYEKVIVIAHDTIFASIRKFVFSCANLQIIWIPHSLGFLFEDEFSNKERIKLEKEAIIALQGSKNDVIGYIGNSFKNTLINNYDVKNNRLVPFINGVYPKFSLFSVSDQEAKIFLQKKKISLNKKIIFAWGRCTYQKGYDILISAFDKFVRENPQYHLILIMPIETSTDKYVKIIKKKIAKAPKRSITAVFNFEKTLPSSILQLSNLDIVVFPARFEGSPLAPLEALLFSEEKTRFVYSNILPHQDIFGINEGTEFLEFTSESIYRAFIKATQKKVIKKRTIPNFVKNTAQGIDIVLTNHA